MIVTDIAGPDDGEFSRLFVELANGRAAAWRVRSGSK
jgi:hypothetical protein